MNVDELIQKESVKIVKKPKAKPPPEPPKPVVEKVVEPVVEKVVEKVVEPAPAPKPSIDVSSIEDADTKAIVSIYLSSDTEDIKKKKLDDFSAKKLEIAWKVISESNPELFRANPVPKNKPSYIDCLSGDVSEKCVKEQKQSKKAKDKKGGKYTRKNI